jgi:hypothetical protein
LSTYYLAQVKFKSRSGGLGQLHVVWFGEGLMVDGVTMVGTHVEDSP